MITKIDPSADKPRTLPIAFDIKLPHAIDKLLREAFDTYSKQLLIAPALLDGKVVVEYSQLPMAGATHIIRKLVTADFDRKNNVRRVAEEMAAAYRGGQQDATDPGYWESWMGVLAGAATASGFEVLQLQVYVHREGGWMMVYNGGHPTDAPMHEPNDPWPEPAGEAPANKGIINTSAAFALHDTPGFEHLATLLREMIAAGAAHINDEVIIDMRNEEQRSRFWRYNDEVRKLWPGM